MLNIYKIIILTIILNSLACKGVQEDQSTIDTQGLDSRIRYGRLPNGFTYLIKSIPEPQEKLYMRFYNKAGANQEDPDQMDAAHGIEHLAFRTTKNFPDGIGENRVIKEEMIKYDYFASSGRKATIYNFYAPKNSKAALEVGLLWFKDIANGLKLSLSNIEQVKGELRQEKLKKKGDLLNNQSASSQLSLKLFPCENDDSNFLAHYENASPEIFRRFYRDWYRPDLLAVSIVGNIENINVLEKRIKDTFSDLISPQNPRIATDCDHLFYTRAPQFHIVERNSDSSKIHPDKTVDLQLIYRDPITMQNLDKPLGMERLTLLSILREVMTKRLNEATDNYKSFNVGVKDTYKYDQLPVTLMVKAELKNTPLEESIQKILKVLRQLQKFGITESEWDELKQKQLNYLNTQKEESADYWLDAIKEFYCNGEVFPAGKLNHRKKHLADLTLSEFNNFAQQFLSKKPMDVGLMVPEGHPLLSLKEEEVRSWIEDEYHNDVVPYSSPEVPENLMNPEEISKLNDVEVVSKKIGESGSHEFLLENGAKLVLKPLNPSSGGSKDKIKIHGFALKGASFFPKEDYFSAVYAPYIIANSGVNRMNKFEINRFLSGHKISPGVVSSYIDSHESGIMGSANLKNLEIILQLIYLHFTNPNKDKHAFEDWELRKLNSDIDAGQWDFKNAIRKSTGDNSVVPLMILGTKYLQRGTELYEGVEKIDLNASYDIYKRLFGNVEDFTFVVSGNFDLKTVFPLLAKYLGNLPALSDSSGDCISKNSDFSLPPGPVYQEFSAIGNYDMHNIKYSIQFLETAKNSEDWKEQLKVEALGGVTTQMAWDLRWRKNYSLYSVGVIGKFNNEMNRYEIASYFDCIPEEYPMIRKEVHQIFADIKSGKITEENFRKGMARMNSFYNSEGRIGQHFMLHQNLYKHYRYGQPWVEPKEVESFVESITVNDIVQTAKKYCKDENRYEFVMWNKEIN